MKNDVKRLIVMLLGSFATCAAYSQAFDFESVPSGYYLSGLVLSNAGQTLTITTEGYPNGYLFIGSPGNVPLLGGQSCIGSQVTPLTANMFSPLRFTFGTPLSSVYILFGDAGGDNDGPVTIAAYDSANHFLGSVVGSYPALDSDGSQLDLNFNNMKYLVLSSAGGENNDNSLNWEVAHSTPVPEPAAFKLLTFIVFVFAGWRPRAG